MTITGGLVVWWRRAARSASFRVPWSSSIFVFRRQRCDRQSSTHRRPHRAGIWVRRPPPVQKHREAVRLQLPAMRATLWVHRAIRKHRSPRHPRRRNESPSSRNRRPPRPTMSSPQCDPSSSSVPVSRATRWPIWCKKLYLISSNIGLSQGMSARVDFILIAFSLKNVFSVF